MGKRGRPPDFDKMLNTASQNRSQEQNAIEDKVIGAGSEDGSNFKSLDKEAKRPTTVIFTRRNYLALKMYSAACNKTFSEVVNGWVEEKCAKVLKLADEMSEEEDKNDKS